MNSKGIAKVSLYIVLAVTLLVTVLYATTGFSDADLDDMINVTLSFPSSPMDYYNSATVPFNYSLEYDAALDMENCTLYGNFTGSWNANMTNQTELVNSVVNTITNVLPGDGAYIWNVYCFNSTGSFDYDNPNATLIIDSDDPEWLGNNTSIVSSYSSTPSVFNITWTDNQGISTPNVYIEGNWSGVVNYTTADGLFSPEAGIYTFNTTLPAGTFYWRSFAKDAAGNWNVTDKWLFTVSKADNPVDLYLNDTRNSNFTYTYPEAINATATTTAGSVNLYRDGASVGTGEEVLLGTGLYSYIVNATGNANYSDNTTGLVFFATVNQGTPVVETFVDELPGNGTVTYPASVVLRGNSTTTVTPPTFNLYLDDLTQTGNPATITTVQGVGVYSLVYNTSGNMNWSAASNSTLYLIVNQNTTNPVLLLFNGTVDNTTYTYPDVINATATASYPNSGTVSLYRDGVYLGTSEEAIFANGTYAYTANITGNANYSSNNTGITLFVFVNKGPTAVSIYLNGTEILIDQNLEYPYPTNINATVNVSGLTAVLELNGTPVSNPDERLSAVGAYNYTGYFIETQNYSGSTTTRIITIDPDTTAPTYVGNVSSTVLVYSPSNYSNFTIVWTDGTGSATAYLENNFTGTMENTSMSGSYPTFYYNSTPLGAGTYQYRFVANDTNGNENATPITVMTITQAVSSVYIYFNGTANANKTDYKYSEVINATAYSPEGTVALYRDGASVGTGEEVSLDLGTYEYKANTTASGNYSSNTSGVTFYATVGKGNPYPYLNVYINGVAGNGSVSYPNTANVSANESLTGDDDCVYTLWRNDTILMNGSYVWNATKYGYGSTSFRYNMSGTCTNWTLNSTNVTYLQVNKGTPTLYLVIDGEGVDKSVTSGTTTNATGYEANDDDELCNYTLYRNSDFIDSMLGNATNGVSNVQAIVTAGSYVYVYNTSGCGNWTSGSAFSRTLTVTASGNTGTVTSSGGLTITTSLSTPYIRLTKDNVNITLNSLTTSSKMIANIAKYDGVAIRGINITVSNNVANLRLVIKKVNVLPSTVFYNIESKAYNYITIDTTNITDSDISTVSIRFAVNKTWLNDTGIADSNITLYRWSGTSWTDLNAQKVSEDSTEVFYNVVSPGLSVFIIGATGGSPLVETPQEDSTQTTTDTTDAEETTTEEANNQETQEMPAFDFNITFLIVLAVALTLSFLIFLKRDHITAQMKKVANKRTSKILDEENTTLTVA